MVVFSLLLVNIFDTIGTVLGLVSKLGVKENEKGEIPGVKEAMMSDAIGTTAVHCWVALPLPLMWRVLRALPRVVSRA